MSYRKMMRRSYDLKRKLYWKPFKFGVCPACEEEVSHLPTSRPKPLPEEPPPVTEIKPQGEKTSPQKEKKPKQPKGETQEEEKDEQRSEEPEEKQQKPEETKGRQPEEEEEADDTEPEEEGDDFPFGAKPEDVEKAKEGNEDIQKEYEEAETKAQKEDEADKITSEFMPVGSAIPPDFFRDNSFIGKMDTALRDWKVGRRDIAGKSGARLSVPRYIRGNDPFLTSIRTSARGSKILVISDFSISIGPRQDDYKKVLISSMEVLDGIGANTALFGFGGEMGSQDSFFFKIKRFEDSRWKPDHSAKTAALTAAGSTPTAQVYEALEAYIKRHHPDVTVTITDGAPDDHKRTEEMVKVLKKHTNMVAFGISPDSRLTEQMEEMLRGFGYNKTFVVDNVKDIPEKMVRLMAPE